MLPVKRTTQRLYSTDSKKKSFSDPVSPTPTSNRIVSISPPLPSIESLPGRGTVTRGTRLSPGTPNPRITAKACRMGVLIHGLAMKNGLDKDDYVAPSLVEMYGEFGGMEDEQKVFDEMPLRSSRGGFGDDNALTLICLVKACGNVFAGREGKSVDGVSIRRGFIDQSGYLQASVVDMYVKCRLLDNAREMFERTVDKNVVMWTMLVSGFAKCERAVEAFDLFREMLGERVLPNQCTLAALLVACSSLGSQSHGRSVHGYMIRNEIEMDAVNFTSFEWLGRKLWIVLPFGKHRRRTEAVCVDDKILRDCTRGRALRVYGIDLLGRAVEVEEAKSFIDSMHVKPMASAWGALLNACRIHKNVDLEEEIAEKLLSVGSNESSVYVLLSNIYADAGVWEMVK
ncbi:hypothetical protein YC2023_056756 [Brassica napus]